MALLPNREKSERTLQYDDLRRSYDTAFREWVIQTNRQRSFAGMDEDGAQALESSAAALRDRQNSLVDFLLRRRRPLTAEWQVREAAYFIWLNAGRPVETAMSDWIAAGRQVAPKMTTAGA